MKQRVTNQTIVQRLWQAAWRRPDGRWPAIRWGLAILVPVALLLWSFSLLLAPGDPELLRITVESQATGGTIPGAEVIVGDIRYVTDTSGAIAIDPVVPGTEVLVSAGGHESTRAEIASDPADVLTVSLSAVLILGSVTDIVSGVPVAGAEIAVLDTSGAEVASARTDESGTFVFKFIPEDAELVITHEVYGEHRQALDDRRSLYIQLAPPPVTGRVVGPDGQPVAGATITGPQVDVVTDAEGMFRLEGAGQGTEIVISGQEAGSARATVSGTNLGDVILAAGAVSPIASPAAESGP